MTQAFLQRIATAVPDHDIHQSFVDFAAEMLTDPRARSIFQRLVAKSDISHRYSCLARDPSTSGFTSDAYSFYASGRFPTTAERMRVFEQAAPLLARRALDRLALSDDERGRVRHLIITCCTGFYAPGLDFDIIDHLGLPSSTERTFIGFMGCYAAMNALKQARHVVRSDPGSLELVVNIELCSLHFHHSQDLTDVLAFLLFADGCSASLIGSEPTGFELDSFHAMRIPNSADLITWRIGDAGFDMFLSTQVPNRIAKSMRESATLIKDQPVDLWAIHPGGRAILDAVEDGLAPALERPLCHTRLPAHRIQHAIRRIHALKIFRHLAAQEAPRHRMPGIACDFHRTPHGIHGHQHGARIGAVVRTDRMHNPERGSGRTHAPSF
jgi:alpha-pyrone synthase